MSGVVAGVGTVLPEHRYPQEEITAAFLSHVDPSGSHRATVERFHASAQVRSRSLALPLEEYAALDGFTAANDAFLRVATDLGGRAVREALDAAGLDGSDVDVFMTTTVTGLAVPSLDARLAGPLGMRPDVRRVPLFGLGCVAGVAGLARLNDHLVGHPDDVAVLLSVELCSLTVQRDDVSTANLVASGLFGDGAAAVVMVGERRARRSGISGPGMVASRSRRYDGTERVMGWDVGSTGFRIVLSADVAELVRSEVGDDVTTFLGDHGCKTGDVARWVCHPGGPKVLVALEESLDLTDGELARTWSSLAQVGNLSSASVLHVLRDVVDDPPPEGSTGLMLAMGPGFCSELALLAW